MVAVGLKTDTTTTNNRATNNSGRCDEDQEKIVAYSCIGVNIVVYDSGKFVCGTIVRRRSYIIYKNKILVFWFFKGLEK